MTKMELRRRRVWGGVVIGFTAVMTVLLIVLTNKQLTWLSTREVYAMAVPATLMPICYTLFFPWWRAPLGRALFVKAAGLLLLIDFSVLFMFVDPFWIEHLEFIIYSTVLIGLCYQLGVMVKIWWATRKEKKNLRYRAYATYDDAPLARAQEEQRVDDAADAAAVVHSKDA